MDPNNATLSYLSNAHPTELISDAVFTYLVVIFKMVLNPILGVLGICTNVINAAVFFRMGLTDGVTQNFFILAISDGLCSAAALTNSLAFIGQRILVAYSSPGGPEIYAQIVHRASYVAYPFPQFLSAITTAVIAIVRCCCVAMPLRVKYLVTATRQLAAIFLLSGTSYIVVIYNFTSGYLTLVPNPLTNTSVVYFDGINSSLNAALSNSIFSSCFIIVIICLIILSVSLARASKFRNMTTSVSGPSNRAADVKSRVTRRDARVVRTLSWSPLSSSSPRSPPSSISFLEVHSRDLYLSDTIKTRANLR